MVERDSGGPVLPPATPHGLRDLQPAMVAIVHDAAAIDLRYFESLDPVAINDELHPATAQVLDRSLELLDHVLSVCTDSDEASDPLADLGAESDIDRVFDAAGSEGASSHVVEQTAFIAQLELRQRQTRIRQALRAGDVTARLTEHESALRRVRRAFAAIDAVVARVERVPPRLDHVPLVQTSLEVRRAYARFADFVRGVGEPSTEQLRPSLRMLGTQLAVLIGWKVYPDLRVADRMLLRGLQERVLGWIRDPDADPADGVRIWSDLVTCVEMFQQVRQRQELREHDVELATRLRPAVRGLAPDQPVPPSVWRDLRTLVGIDPSCDPALLRKEPVLGRDAVEILERVAGRVLPAEVAAF